MVKDFKDAVMVFQGYIDGGSIGEDVALALFIDLFADTEIPPVDWTDFLEYIEGVA